MRWEHVDPTLAAEAEVDNCNDGVIIIKQVQITEDQLNDIIKETDGIKGLYENDIDTINFILNSLDKLYSDLKIDSTIPTEKTNNNTLGKFEEEK